MLKVLIITGSYPPDLCGVGDYTFHLAETLAADSNKKVAVLTSISEGATLKSSSVKVFRLMPDWKIKRAFMVKRFIEEFQPDVVHIQYPTQGYGIDFLPMVLPLISLLMGRKVVQTWHEHQSYSILEVTKVFFKAIIPGCLVVVRPKYKENFHPLLSWVFWNKRVIFIRNASTIPIIKFNENEIHSLRKKYLKGQKRLIVFFGFVYPHKRVELLLEIANPDTDQIVIAGAIDRESKYQRELMTLCSSKTWLGKVTITGYISSTDVGPLLHIADAVVLPFYAGGGEWNTSIHGAVLMGTCVITTSLTQRGYDKKYNVYYAKVDDVLEMKSALNNYAGKRRKFNRDIDKDDWQQIANEHCAVYRDISKI